MPILSGSFRDIVSGPMDGRNGELILTLNAPNVFAAGLSAGRVVPTAPHIIKFTTSDDTFSVNVAQTTAMLYDAWYTMQIRWQDSGFGATLVDFPDWQIRVGTSNVSIQDAISRPGKGPGINSSLWWVGLTPPPSQNFIWNYLDPDNPDRETGPIPGLTLGDIITGGW